MLFENLGVKYGNKIIYENFNLSIPDNTITCFIGASGCGKTTLLNAVANIIPYTGKITKESEKISYIFQKPTLFDHLTVKQNIDLFLKSIITNKSERIMKINNILKEVGLENEKDNYPFALSGGMAQRVSLARAFSYPSDILLMDEPFTGIDIVLKRKMIILFTKLLTQNKKTVLWITHDVSDALKYADQIVILQGEGKYFLFNVKKLTEEDNLTNEVITERFYEIICQG